MKPNDELLHETWRAGNESTRCSFCERILTPLNPGIVGGLLDFVLCLECLLRTSEALTGHAKNVAHVMEILP